MQVNCLADPYVCGAATSDDAGARLSVDVAQAGERVTACSKNAVKGSIPPATVYFGELFTSDFL